MNIDKGVKECKSIILCCSGRAPYVFLYLVVQHAMGLLNLQRRRIVNNMVV